MREEHPQPQEVRDLDPCVYALMPVLLHELNNQTQLLTGLRAVLDMGGADDLFVARADDLVRAGDRARELGFALAVLGSASGANVLLSRRDPRAVEYLLDLVRRAASREGLTLELDPSEAPDLAPSALDGWQVPWAVASAVWSACRAGATNVTWVRSVGWVGARVTGPVSAPSPHDELPGARVESIEGGYVLAMPEAWFHPR